MAVKSDMKFFSAELKNGEVSSLKIRSLKGRECTVECRGIKSVVRESDKKEQPFKRDEDKVTFETDADSAYILI